MSAATPARKPRGPLVRNLVAGGVTLVLVIAVALWIWPGFLRNSTPKVDPAQSSARAALEGFVRGDPQAVDALIPPNGADRTLLGPAFASAAFGPSPSIELQSTTQNSNGPAWQAFVTTPNGTVQLEITMTQLEGPDGPWTPLPLGTSGLLFQASSTLGDSPKITVNGVEVPLTPSMQDRPLPSYPVPTTFGPGDAEAPLVERFTPAAVALNGSSSRGGYPIPVSVTRAAGRSFPQAASRALEEFLSACASQGEKQEPQCPLVPPPLTQGASERKNLEFTSVKVTSGAPNPLDATKLSQVFQASAQAQWEEKVGGSWRKAKGSNTFSVYGSFAPQQSSLKFVPDEDYSPFNLSDRAKANTDFGTAPRNASR